MDRASASIPKAQQGFLKYICQPIFTAMAQPLPTLAESAGRYVEHNIETLRQLEAYPTDQVRPAVHLPPHISTHTPHLPAFSPSPTYPVRPPSDPARRPVDDLPGPRRAPAPPAAARARVGARRRRGGRRVLVPLGGRRAAQRVIDFKDPRDFFYRERGSSASLSSLTWSSVLPESRVMLERARARGREEGDDEERGRESRSSLCRSAPTRAGTDTPSRMQTQSLPPRCRC